MEEVTGQAISDRVAEFMAERDRFAKSLGIEILELRPGYCRAGMKLTPEMVNGLGVPHGAAIFALADLAFAASCNSYGEAAVALSMDIHFLASPPPDTFLEAEATEVRRGRKTGLYRLMVRDDSGQPVAELHGMAYIKGDPFLEQDSED